MSKDKEKEIKYLIYLKNELIKEQKKELMELRRQLIEYQNEKYGSKPKVKKK